MPAAFDQSSTHGDPRIVEAAVRCRVTRAGWYGPDGRPVEVDEVIKLPRSDAFSARALGQVEFVS